MAKPTTFPDGHMETVYELVTAAENDLGKLSPEQRLSLLLDNTNFTTDYATRILSDMSGRGAI